MSRLLIFLLVLPFFNSCSNSMATSNDSESDQNFSVLYNSEYGGSGSDRVEVITDLHEWSMFWADLTYQPSLSAPKFNPDTKMIIRKDFQSRNMGGNEYTVSEVKIDGNQINVEYSIKSSKIGTDAITAPIMLIMVQKVENPQVRFVQVMNDTP